MVRLGAGLFFPGLSVVAIVELPNEVSVVFESYFNEFSNGNQAVQLSFRENEASENSFNLLCGSTYDALHKSIAFVSVAEDS